ncbi:hypothetical protein B0H14DRAFT_3145182 [Mycena olivaceomarginata]|nr:hypothetical protein B0H14DRAFT_3145182 [Mycena olivaceomarginata]
MVQNVKRNKDECAQLMENIHPVLYAIINLHLKAETVESPSPEMLHNLGNFMETLHKIYTFLEGQQDGNRIKYLFRNNEVQKLFRDCHAGLDQACGSFLRLHQTSFDLIFNVASKAQDLLWSSIWRWRTIMKMLNQESPRIAILGGGGMGKTSLAKAILHYPQTLEKFQHRFFTCCPVLVTKAILSSDLDNLETVWEPMQSRGGIEEFLSLLTEGETPCTPNNAYTKEDVEQILQFTDNMPLAVDLIAHLSDYEGLSNVLARWQTERTSLLTLGYDRKSNVDVSISPFSLQSQDHIREQGIVEPSLNPP